MRFFGLFVFLGTISLAVGAAELSPRDVIAAADAKGNRAALAEFFACDASGNLAYSMVSSGSNQWLAVAVRLLPSADACYSESLQSAIARALVPAPARVLSLVGSVPALTAQRVCVPFLSAEEPASDHLAYLHRAEKAVRSVRTPALQAARGACLAEIGRIRKRLSNGL